MSRRPSVARLILLVGPKGSGKTTLGQMLESERGVHFVEVESIAKRVLAQMGGTIDEAYARRAFEEIAAEVEAISGLHRTIVLETTGASTETPRFLDTLRRTHEVLLVRVRASAEVCATRIAHRDASRQVEVSAELIRTMHARTEALHLDWDLEIDNDPPLTQEQVLRAFGPLLHTATSDRSDSELR